MWLKNTFGMCVYSKEDTLTTKLLRVLWTKRTARTHYGQVVSVRLFIQFNSRTIWQILMEKVNSGTLIELIEPIIINILFQKRRDNESFVQWDSSQLLQFCTVKHGDASVIKPPLHIRRFQFETPQFLEANAVGAPYKRTSTAFFTPYTEKKSVVK